MNRFLIILLLSCHTYVYSQGWSVNYSIGYGSYQLNDIKKLLHSMPTNYGLKETDYFPDYMTHTVSLGYVTKHSYFGSQFSYLTTGGRLSRADYSGSYTVDMIMNGYRVGAFYRQNIHTKVSPLDFYLQLGSGALASNLKMKEQVNVFSESAQDNNTLSGIGMYLEPSIGATYRLAKYLHLSLGAGYEADFLGKLKYSGQETQVVANWSGFRLYGGFIIILPVKKIAQ